MFAYNSSRHESSTFSPFEVMFGRKAYLPVEIDTEKSTPEEELQTWVSADDFNAESFEKLTGVCQWYVEEAKCKIIEAQKKQKHYYDLKHSKPCLFDVGAQVLLKDFRRKKRKGGKLDPKWLGPFSISKDLGKGAYSLTSTDNPSCIVKRANGAYLKPYYSPSDLDEEDFLSPPASLSS